MACSLLAKAGMANDTVDLRGSHVGRQLAIRRRSSTNDDARAMRRARRADSRSRSAVNMTSSATTRTTTTTSTNARRTHRGVAQPRRGASPHASGPATRAPHAPRRGIRRSITHVAIPATRTLAERDDVLHLELAGSVHVEVAGSGATHRDSSGGLCAGVQRRRGRGADDLRPRVENSCGLRLRRLPCECGRVGYTRAVGRWCFGGASKMQLPRPGRTGTG